MKLPKPYLVTVTFIPDGSTKEYTARVGGAETVKDAGELIRDDLTQMRQTFGGLIEVPRNIKSRVYRVFKAEWTEVTAEELV